MKSFSRILLVFLGVPLAALAIYILRSPGDESVAGASAASPAAAPATQAKSAGTKETRHYRPRSANTSVREEADQLIQRYKGLKRAEFEKSLELQELGARFSAHLDSPDFQRKLESVIEDLKVSKGIEHGTLSFDLHDLETPNARAWIEAALSDDPQLARDYVLNLLEGAVFEFAIDPDADSTSDGVTVKGIESSPGSNNGE